MNYAPDSYAIDVNNKYPTLSGPTQGTFAPNGANPNNYGNQNQYGNYAQQPRPNVPGSFGTVNYANPYAQMTGFQPQYPPQNTQNNAQRNMMIHHQMKKNIKASGQGLVIFFALLSVVAGFVIFASLVKHNAYEQSGKLLATLRLKDIHPVPDLMGPLIIEMNQKSANNILCVAYVAGFISAPFIAGLILAVWNILASILACCGLSCVGYLQIIWTLLYTALAVYEKSPGCEPYAITAIKLLSNNNPESWPFYMGAAILSLLSAIANFCWASSQSKAEKEKRDLSLMVALNN